MGKSAFRVSVWVRLLTSPHLTSPHPGLRCSFRQIKQHLQEIFGYSSFC